VITLKWILKTGVGCCGIIQQAEDSDRWWVGLCEHKVGEGAVSF